MRAVPAISMHQPWASLLFVADPALRKWHETRGRALPENRKGVRHAIHAAKMVMRPRLIPGPLHRLCVDAFGWDYRESLPRGAVIGTVVFGGSYPTDVGAPHNAADLTAGDWTSGRFAWPVLEPLLLQRPVPMQGRQSWFTVDLP